MSNFYEIDFLDVETKKSGDAIALRYELNGLRLIHLVDGGFQALSDKIINHIVAHFNDKPIDHVVVTHPDGDHAGGLRGILERCNVGALWMLRPWLYADHLIGAFENYNSPDHLARRLKQIYPNLAALEEIAIDRGIPIYEPFQGAQIGAFTVLAPSPARYFNLVIHSEKTPEAVDEQQNMIAALLEGAWEMTAKALNFLKGEWGFEVFSSNDTSAENDMSVVQCAILSGHRIVLTGDAGRGALQEAADYAPNAGLFLPGVDLFQVPHHGSRRNVSTELLDRWLGPRLDWKLVQGTELFHAVCSSALEDPHHPRKSVERAFVHRGGRFTATEGSNIFFWRGIEPRSNVGPLPYRPYPDTYEEG